MRAGGEALKKRMLGEDETDDSAAAQRFVKGLDELKGAAMKLGQLLSLSPDDDFLPRAWKQALSKLHSEATAKDWSYVEPLLKQAFPDKWPYEKIEHTAVHAASIAQVHRAWLKDGTPVAVKIRYPDLEKNIKSDLEGMKRMLKLAMVLPNKNNYDKVASEIETLLLQELDFERERHFYEFYRESLKNSDHFYVPKVFAEGCTSGVLTTEWMSGESIEKWLENTSDSAQGQIQRNKIGEAVAELLFTEIFSLGYVQTDPNPGNFLVLPDGKLGLLDFGATQKLTQSILDDYRLLTHGLVFEKQTEITKASIHLDLVKREDSEHVWDSYKRMTRLVSEPFRTETYNWKNCGLAKRAREEGMRFGMVTKLRPPPAEIVFLHRRVLGTQLLLENIGCNLNAREIVKKYLTVEQQN